LRIAACVSIFGNSGSATIPENTPIQTLNPSGITSKGTICTQSHNSTGVAEVYSVVRIANEDLRAGLRKFPVTFIKQSRSACLTPTKFFKKQKRHPFTDPF
jgi:hypothetical protein